MWILWSILSGINYIIQINHQAGPGAWGLGISTIMCFCIFLLAFKKGTKTIVLLDWYCFTGAIIGIILWLYTGNPVASVILTSIVATLSFIPTIRKSWYKPHEETLLTFIINVVKWTAALLVVTEFNFFTAFYLIWVTVMNSTLALIIIIRKRLINKL